MKALVGGDSGSYRLADDIDIPEPKPDGMLCRVYAVALSPYDAKIVDFSNTPGAVGGCDFAGTVVEVGQSVTRFKAGDRILAVTFGLNPSDKTAGAFADYALAIEDLSCHIPDDLSWTQACSMGLGIATAGLALFEAPGLKLVPCWDAAGVQKQGDFVLVSGGATGTGTMASQLLRSAGYTPIVTCSPANNALCTSYGAAACFDYSSPSCAAEIREYTSDSLSYVFDCVTNASTMRMCYGAIGSAGGHYVALEATTTAVKYTRREFNMPKDVAGLPEICEWYQNRGFTALIFDTYGIGASDGEPRCDTDMHRRVDDFMDAVTWLTSDPLVDPAKIVLWGLCFDGNIMLATAASDRRVAAVVSVAPMVDVTGDPERREPILELALADRAGQLAGEEPMYLPLVDEDGVMPLGQISGLGFFSTMENMNMPVENRVTVQSYARALNWNILHLLPKISPTPVIMITPELDQVYPASKQKAAFDMLGTPKQHVVIPGKDHFNWMFGDMEGVFEKQHDFLKQHLTL
ncbi:hypothetical protein KCU78_g732, partial [Aureobasidium melanogenum]